MKFSDGTDRNQNIYTVLRSTTTEHVEYQEEGTLFYLEFNSGNTAESITIFHQGHRDTLQVATISWEKLQSFIEQTAQQAAIPPTPPPTFTLRSEDYLSSIGSFNSRFNGLGIAVHLIDNDDGSSDLAVTRLGKTPKVLAAELSKLELVESVTHGSKYPSVQCLATNSSDPDSGAWLDLLPVTSDISDPPKAHESTLEAGAHTAILLGRNSRDVIELVVNYMSKPTET